MQDNWLRNSAWHASDSSVFIERTVPNRRTGLREIGLLRMLIVSGRAAGLPSISPINLLSSGPSHDEERSNSALDLTATGAAHSVLRPLCLRARSMARSGLVPLANWKAKADQKVTRR